MMRLTIEQLRAFALGVNELEQTDGVLRVHRHSPALREVYGNNESRQIRSACTAGCRFRFRSDTGSLSLSLRYGRRARQRLQGTLVLDDQTHLPFGPTEPGDAWQGVVSLPGGRVTRVLDLWLPHTAECIIESIAVDQGATVEPAPAPKLRWLLYGDSITQGMDGTAPTATWMGRCAMALGAHALNTAVGGAILEPALADADPQFPDADLVTIAFGTNDFSQNIPAATFVDLARELIAALRKTQPGASIVMMSPPPWVDCKPRESGYSLDDLRAAIQSLAAPANRVSVVNGGDLMPCDKRYLPDNVHPNDEGFAIFAQRLIPQLKAALSQPLAA